MPTTTHAPPTPERVTLGRMRNPVRGFLNGAAAVAFGVGGVFLWARAAGDVTREVALLVFATSQVALYTVSSLYHSVDWRDQWKERMRRLDHSMIYVLIAGTYTPLAAIVFDGWLRIAVLVAVWSIAAIGALQKALLPRIGSGFSIRLQTFQGGLAILLLLPLAQRLPWAALVLGILGGLLSTLGMGLFVTRRPRLWPHVFSYHEVFHICVVSGSVAHYAMTLWYVAPFAEP